MTVRARTAPGTSARQKCRAFFWPFAREIRCRIWQKGTCLNQHNLLLGKSLSLCAAKGPVGDVPKRRRQVVSLSPKKQRAPSNVEVLSALSKREKETTMLSKCLILILCLLGALSLNASIEVNIHIDFALEASLMFALIAAGNLDWQAFFGASAFFLNLHQIRSSSLGPNTSYLSSRLHT